MIIVKYDEKQESTIRTRADFHMADTDAHSTNCYSCGMCTSSCPVSFGPGGLDPRRIVHLANIGNLDIQRVGTSIWHCLDCHRCGNLCPNSVKPWSLIDQLKRQAIQEGKVSPKSWSGLEQLKKELVMVLSNTLALHHSPSADEIYQKWDQFAMAPEKQTEAPIPIRLQPGKHHVSQSFNHALCLTCRECSSACPICNTTAGFDPLYFIRCYVLGLPVERAAIWSCLQCESCTQACSQAVKGHLVIKALQEEQETFFSIPFQMRIQNTRERVFRVYTSRVDVLLEKEPDTNAKH